jgi:hypothetical protein
MKRQLGRVVVTLPAVNDGLSRHDRILGMEKERLFRREMPVRPESLGTVSSTKLPKGCEPGCTVSWACTGAGGHQPSFDDRLQEAALHQTIAMYPAQFSGSEDVLSLFLEIMQSS